MIRLAVACLLACCSYAAYPRVVVSENAPEVEQFAAQELKNYLINMSARLTKEQEEQMSTDGGIIAVGYDASISLGLPASELQGLGNDSFVLSSNRTGIKKGSWVISGGENSARGTLFAVYEFLRALGCEFLAPDCTMAEEIPTNPPTKLPQIDKTYKPLYEYRDNNEWIPTQNHVWAGKVGYNGATAHAATPNAGKTYANGWFVHTGYLLLGAADGHSPPPDLWKEHREWFWPRGDNDSKVYGQLCWSNSSLVDYMTQRVRLVLRANPDANIISVSQMDNYEYCKDPTEVAINTAEGTEGGALFRAINTIAAAIADEFPNVAVDTLAYQWSRPAPALTKPRCNFAAPLTDPSNAPFQQDMEKWAAISNRTYIWNYVTSFGSYLLPFPNWYVLGPNIQYFAQHGVRGIFEEGSYGTPGADMQPLKSFIIGRMLWDVNLQPDALITQFLDGYYGRAAPFVRLYMDLFHGAIAETGYYMRENVPVTAPFVTALTSISAAQAFTDALAVTVTDPLRHGRVDAAKVSIYYVLLLRWEEFHSFAGNNSIAWPVESTKEAAWTEFERVWNEVGIRYERESQCNITCFKSQVFRA